MSQHRPDECSTCQTAIEGVPWEQRKKIRSRIDLRGLKLTADGRGGIKEIEEALNHFWVELQDSPDEIVVDSLAELTDLLIEGMSPEIKKMTRFYDGKPFEDHVRRIGSHWNPKIRRYLSKYGAEWPNEGIPIFENV